MTERGLTVPADVRYADVGDSRFAFREHGVGEPVVFVHGSISDLTVWDSQLEVTGERFRAISYSRRYAWPNSDLPRGSMDRMQPHVDDLLAFLRAVDAEPAHLVGNSWGAFISLRLAMQHPDSVCSLVLEEPPLVPLVVGAPPSPAHIVRSVLRRPRLTLTTLRFAASTIAPMSKLAKTDQITASIDRFAVGVLGQSVFEKLPAEMRAHMYANANTHIGQALAEGGFEPLTEMQIAAVATPTLVVVGQNSPVVLRELAALLTELLPDSRRVDIPDASHVMHLQNPSAVNHQLLTFLSDP
ncbi:MAG: alpha/beta hydrolase [Mycobacterium sp.]|nr:alpha/beta hydrolase [Mycobacterium sp.]